MTAHARARKRRTPAAAALSLAALLPALLTGCAHRVGVPPVVRPPAGYERRIDALDAVDRDAVRGKRIAIDPGHGGFFPGSIGTAGLTEAEVNLGVALHLRTLLEANGASVRLTRDSDRDFLTLADSSLRSDLAERVRLASEFRPDLFISIHHNADAGGRHDVNETQVYWKLTDEGPSLEVATDVHRALTRNLGIGASRLLPGNYAVLRGSEAPAILTESSYLTYPPTEARLRLDENRKLEAEALYLGIARYFMRRIPVIESFAARSEAPGADSTIAWRSLRLDARIAGAFDSAVLRIDGDEVPAARIGDSLTWRPRDPLVSGEHSATLSVRLAGEGTARPRNTSFRLSAPAEFLTAAFIPPGDWNGREPLAMRVRALDTDGLPVRDSLVVRLDEMPAGRLAPAETLVVLRDGVGWAYFRPAAHQPSRRTPLVRVRAQLWPPAPGTSGAPRVPIATAEFEWRPESAARARTAFVRLMPADSALRDAPGTTGMGRGLDWLNRDGLTLLVPDSSGAVRVPELPGFRRWSSDPPWPPRFAAIAGGALQDRRITLDPEGGGEDGAGVSVSGTRAAALNLEVARALGSMLRAAGAEVLITRERDDAVSDLERVRRSEAFHAERFVRIGHGARAPRLGYYWSSVAGKRFATSLATQLDSLGLPAAAPGEDAAWAIQQTSCTALNASLARIDEPATEARLLAAGTLRREAYALYLALAREWAPDAAWPLDSLVVRDAAGTPLAGAPVVLGDALVLLSDATGRVLFARTEPGPIEVQVNDPRLKARAVLLDSTRGSTLTGPR